MPNDDQSGFEASVGLILEECRLALSRIDPQAVENLVDAILAADKVFVVGVGRVFLSLQAFAKRLSHPGHPGLLRGPGHRAANRGGRPPHRRLR